jgi:hypothetical protein
MSTGHAPRGSAGPDLLAAGQDDRGKNRVVPPWVWRIAGLLVVGVVAAVAGPDLLSSLSPKQPPAAASAGRRAPSTAPVDPNGTFVEAPRWSPRGPEVGSEIEAAELARIRVERPGVDGLLWAGSLDGHDHAVLVSYPRQPTQSGTDAIQVVALHVRRAGDVATARSETVGYLSEAGGVVGIAWQGDDLHTRLLLLGRPGHLQVQVSPVVDYHPSGRISRRWQDTGLNDGVAVTDLGRRVDPFLLVRPKIAGLASSGLLVPVEGRRELPRAGGVTVAGASSESYAGPDARVLVHSMSQALGMLLDLGDADSTVLWSGRIASGRTEEGKRVTGRGALVLVRRHDGPMFQAFVYADKTGGSARCTANTVRWSVADRSPFAFSTNEPGAPQVLVNPGGRGSATLTSAAGARLHVRLDGNGVGTLAVNAAAGPRIGGAEVVVRDRSGRITLRSTMPDTGTADAFGRYL